ncbi:MAG: 2-oxo-tetronate isomerase [Edaphobacter sp.]
MLRFAANLTMMYTELPFLERFAAAAADGFEGVEFLFPYDWPAETLEALLYQHELQQVLINAPPGDWIAGERGIAALPGRQTEFRSSFRLACDYARTLRCSRIHVMAGIVPSNTPSEACWSVYRENLGWAADHAAVEGIEVLVEPINARDMPGYVLRLQAEAHDLVTRLGRSNLKVQMDLYHTQITEADTVMLLGKYLGDPQSRVAHLQIAGVPNRHEPDEGDLDYPNVFHALEELGYTGWVGCEYRPRAGTSEGLGWLRDYRR